MKILLMTVMCCVLMACGSSSPLTAAQEQSSLQGTWSGDGIALGTESFSGPATLTVSGSTGSLNIPSACPVTFNLPLTMEPFKKLAGSQFHAEGQIPENGYSISGLTGVFVSTTQVTLTVPFQTPCQAQAALVQFTLTK